MIYVDMSGANTSRRIWFARSTGWALAPMFTRYMPELHAELFSCHTSLFEVCVFAAVAEEVKMLRPTRFVIIATENSKEGGVAADVCSSQTGL